VDDVQRVGPSRVPGDDGAGADEGGGGHGEHRI